MKIIEHITVKFWWKFCVGQMFIKVVYEKKLNDKKDM